MQKDGELGGDPPPVAQDSQNSANPPQNDSSTTPTDLVVGDKRKQIEQPKTRHKKRKVDKIV